MLKNIPAEGNHLSCGNTTPSPLGEKHRLMLKTPLPKGKAAALRQNSCPDKKNSFYFNKKIKMNKKIPLPKRKGTLSFLWAKLNKSIKLAPREKAGGHKTIAGSFVHNLNKKTYALAVGFNRLGDDVEIGTCIKHGHPETAGKRLLQTRI